MATITCVKNTLGSKVSIDQIMESRLFTNWRDGFEEGWKLNRLEVVAAYRWSDEIKLIQATTVTTDPNGQDYTRAMLLRGDTVEVLPVLIDPEGNKYVVLAEEARPGLGRTMRAIAAGMIDPGETPPQAASRERSEEVGGRFTWGPVVSLTGPRFGEDIPLVVSPGGIDERAFFYASHAHATRDQIDQLHGSTSGMQEEGECITNIVVPIESAYTALVSPRGEADLKSVQALDLYWSASK